VTEKWGIRKEAGNLVDEEGNTINNNWTTPVASLDDAVSPAGLIVDTIIRANVITTWVPLPERPISANNPNAGKWVFKQKQQYFAGDGGAGNGKGCNVSTHVLEWYIDSAMHHQENTY